MRVMTQSTMDEFIRRGKVGWVHVKGGCDGTWVKKGER